MSNTVKGPADIIMETYLAKGNPNVLRESIESALEEYASKLHLLQQEYDKLKGENRMLEADHYELKREFESLEKAAIEQSGRYVELGVENSSLKSEYNKLKAHDEVAVSMLEVLRKEYQELKGKAEKMAQGLAGIIKWEFSTDGRKFSGDHKEVLKQVIDLANAALSYNSQTNNQNENNG